MPWKNSLGNEQISLPVRVLLYAGHEKYLFQSLLVNKFDLYVETSDKEYLRHSILGNL